MALPTLANATGPQVTTASPIPLPSGGVDGDSVLLIVSTYALTSFSLPSPWVMLQDVFSAGTQRYAAWAAPWSSGLTANATTSPVQYMQITTMLVQGARPVADWDVGTTWPRSGHGTSTTTVAPSITATYNDTLVLGAFVERTSAVETDVTSVTNSTEAYFFGKDPLSSNIETTTITTKSVAAGVASGDVTVTYPNVQSSNSIGQLLGIPGVASSESHTGSVALSGSGTLTATGTASEAGVVNLTGSGTLTGTQTGVTATASVALAGSGTLTATGIKGGSPLARWLALDVPYCAHRDGFYDVHGEFTLAGFAALTAWNPDVAWNIDVFKTSDGEWVASHDQTTGRVLSGTSLDIPSSTWAAISGKTTLVGGNPVARLDDIVAAAPADTVFFIDNKQNADPTGFFAKLAALGLGPENVVNKNFIGSLGTLNAAIANGYTTWGYGFDASMSSFAANHGKATWLGFDYAGTQPNWNTVIGYGQPSFAHILTSLADKATADSKAATAGGSNFGYMVANVAAVVPAQGSVNLSGSGALSATGVASESASGSAALSGSGSLSASGVPSVASSVALSGVGALTASGSSTESASGSVALSGSGALTVTGVPAASGSATLSGSGSLTASGSASEAGMATVALTGSGSLTASGAPSVSGTVTLTGGGALSVVSVVALAGMAELSGVGALSAVGVAAAEGDAVAVPRGSLTVTIPATSLEVTVPATSLTTTIPATALEVTS